MKKVPALVMMAVFLSIACYAQELVARKDGSIRNVDARALIADSGESYLATRNEIYRAAGDGGRWESVFTLPPGENEISCLGGTARTVFAGTRRGLYRSQDFGKTWQKVFSTIIPGKSSVLCVECSRSRAGEIVIGTERGVFRSPDNGGVWRDVSANLKSRRVRCVTTINGVMYACAEDGLYMRAEEGSGWERLVVRSAVFTNEGAGIDDADGSAVPGEEPDAGKAVNCIAGKGKALYLGLDTEVLSSGDGGITWRDFPSRGLHGIINHIRTSARSGKIYCATMKGVFVFDPDAPADGAPGWKELYKGTDKVFNANALVYGDETETFLWALTDQGLYRLEWAPVEPQKQAFDVEHTMATFRIIHDAEPSFNDLQRAAMKFADVEPDKIRRWQAQSRLKALVPKVSIGVDHDSQSSAEIYTSATQRYILEGPPDTGDGWDVSLSWELSDLVWSSDQTSIDVRSRLTTQLRNDILDDLRRVYFERKRLLFELITAPPQDQKLAFEKELRVQELTQAIDDLTGNYLSLHSKKEAKSAFPPAPIQKQNKALT